MEAGFWGGLGMLITSLLLYIFVIDTATFIQADLNNSFVTEEGTAIFFREPLLNNMTVEFVEEMVTVDGYTCPNPDSPNEGILEKFGKDGEPFFVAKIELGNWVDNCLMPGSVYSITAKYGFWRATNYRLVVRPDIQQRILK